MPIGSHPPDDELLRRHSLSNLEDAERRLRRHIRRRRPRPSLVRRLIGLCFSIPGIAFGLFVVVKAISSGHYFGLYPTLGITLFIGGLIWIYSDWFE